MLRALILTGCCLLAAAHARAEDQPPKFAPGATETVDVDVMGLLEGAKKAAEGLGAELQTAAPSDLGGWAEKIETLEDAARTDPRVRGLLGVGPGKGASPAAAGQGEKPSYGQARILVFASLGMPKESLRQIFHDADRFGATVVVRGFVGNSVVKTGEALRAVMPINDATAPGAGTGASDTAAGQGASDPGLSGPAAAGRGAVAEADQVFQAPETTSRAGGLAIDPTLFRRFKVEAVPVYVVLAEPLATCESQGCAEDPLPRHDRIAGNISLEAALEMVARAKGDAAGQARVALLDGNADATATPSVMPSSSVPTGGEP